LEGGANVALEPWEILLKVGDLDYFLRIVFFLDFFCKLLKPNIPREVRAAETLDAVVFTDACYERNSVDWPCGLGGVFFLQQEVCFFSLKVNAAAREALGE